MVRSPRLRIVGRKSRVGLALAGGGPLGGIYEVGALLALDEALEGVDFNRLDVYVGVSAGSLVASILANGYTTAQLFRMLVQETGHDRLNPEIFFRPALSEYIKRVLSLPGLTMSALVDVLKNPLDLNLLARFSRLDRAIPPGLFDNTPIHQYLEQLFTAPGCSNEFDALSRELYVVTVQLDTGELVPFGPDDGRDVSISKAVQASTALPGLYVPVEIDGEYYVDGALRKTLNASVALERGVDLLFCVNPLVAYDVSQDVGEHQISSQSLMDGGLPVVMSQTFRAIIHSRMVVGMEKYEHDYPGRDVLLFEPESSDSKMFFTNVFSFADRRRVCRHAYESTWRDLMERRDQIEPILRRNGIRLRTEAYSGEPQRMEKLLNIIDRRSRRYSRSNRVLHDLQNALNDLEGWLTERA